MISSRGSLNPPSINATARPENLFSYPSLNLAGEMMNCQPGSVLVQPQIIIVHNLLSHAALSSINNVLKDKHNKWSMRKLTKKKKRILLFPMEKHCSTFFVKTGMKHKLWGLANMSVQIVAHSTLMILWWAQIPQFSSLDKTGGSRQINLYIYMLCSWRYSSAMDKIEKIEIEKLFTALLLCWGYIIMLQL